MARSGPNTAGCARIRLTVDDDLTTKKGLERALHELGVAQAIAPGHLTLWAAIPCIGGCLWQKLNRRFPHARARIGPHRVVWRQIWDNLVVAAGKAMLKGAIVVIEWPQQCLLE